jgi:glycosyltransferase involved in cell wall biosynthesis
MPKISVVITTFNRASLLGRCLDSVFAQTFTDFEVIVVDDASTDETSQVLSRYVDPRLVAVRLEKNAGAPAHPRNVGIARARSALLFIFDSDDTMAPECLSTFVDAFEKDEKIGMAWSWKRMIDQHGKDVGVDRRDRVMREALLPLVLTFAPGANGLALRRIVVDAIGGFDEKLPRMDDYDMMLRFALDGRWRVSVLPVVTMDVHTDAGDHISTSTRRTLLAVEHLLSKHRAVFARYPRQRAAYLYQVAVLRLVLNDDRRGFLGALVSSLVADPWQLRRAATLRRFITGPPERKATRAHKPLVPT